eukprot:734344-Amphidinium_carterae.1
MLPHASALLVLLHEPSTVEGTVQKCPIAGGQSVKIGGSEQHCRPPLTHYRRYTMELAAWITRWRHSVEMWIFLLIALYPEISAGVLRPADDPGISAWCVSGILMWRQSCRRRLVQVDGHVLLILRSQPCHLPENSQGCQPRLRPERHSCSARSESAQEHASLSSSRQDVCAGGGGANAPNVCNALI